MHRIHALLVMLVLFGCSDHQGAFDLSSYGKIAPPILKTGDHGLIADGDFSTGAGTDNGPALNAYIAASTTGEIVIPAGCYKIATRVDIPSGLTVSGAGMWTTKLFCPTAYSSDVIRLSGSGGAPTRLSGLSVLGQVGGSFGATGIRSNANGTFIDNVWVNGLGVGIVVAGTDTFLSSFAIEYCTTGLSISTTDISVSHGTLYGCANGCAVDNSMAVSGPVLISGVRATTCWQNGFVIDNSRNVSLSGCSAAHNNSGAFSASGFSTGGTSDGIQFNGCTAFIGGAPSATGTGLRIADYATNVSVSGCHFRGWNRGIYAPNPLAVTSIVGAISSGNTVP